MLPILRILPVGGVLLAIFILFLALNPPDGPRLPLNTAMAPARGALVDVSHHPETRQFLIMAALKRADELNRLRELPDTPTRTAPRPVEPAAIEPAPTEPVAEEPTIAGLPADRSESDPDPDEPAATETPKVSIPVETGEVSAPDLPVAPQETNSTEGKPEPAKEEVNEQAKDQTKDQAKDQIKDQAKDQTKAQTKPQRDVRRRVAHRPRRAKVASVPQRPFNLLEALFGGPHYRYPQIPGTQQAAQSQYQARYQAQYQGRQQQGQYLVQQQGQYQQPAYGAQPAQSQYQLQAPTEPYPMLRQHSY
jgi:hypothetical protein